LCILKIVCKCLIISYFGLLGKMGVSNIPCNNSKIIINDVIHKLLIKQKWLIRRSNILFHEKKIIFHVTQQLYNFINLITSTDLCEFENLMKINFIV